MTLGYLRKLGIAAIVAALVLGTGYVWTALSHKLDKGNSSYSGEQAQRHEAGPHHELRYLYVPDGQFTFGASIRNPGPWPVTITDVRLTGIEPPGNRLWQVDNVTAVYMNPQGGGRGYGPSVAEPLRPTKLEKDAQLGVFLTITFPADLKVGPARWYVDQMLVSYEVLGIARRQWVPLGFYVAIEAGVEDLTPEVQK